MNNQNGLPETIPTPMEMKSVNSSNISGVNFEAGTLFVGFKSGTLWAYLNVPQAVYDALCAAPSIGQYFAANIKDQYEAHVTTPADQVSLTQHGNIKPQGETNGDNNAGQTDIENHFPNPSPETIAATETAGQDDSVAGDQPADTDAAPEKTAEEHHLSMWQTILNHFGAHFSREVTSDENGVVTFDLIKNVPEAPANPVVATGTFLDLHNAALQGTDPAEFAPQPTTGPQETSAADDTAGASTAKFVVKGTDPEPEKEIKNTFFENLKNNLGNYGINFDYQHQEDENGRHWNLSANVGNEDETRHISMRFDGEPTDSNTNEIHGQIIKEFGIGGSR